MGIDQAVLAADALPEQSTVPVIETYHYESFPQGGGEGDKESVTMEYAATSSEIRCSSVSTSLEYTERIEIAMHPEGSTYPRPRK